MNLKEKLMDISLFAVGPLNEHYSKLYEGLGESFITGYSHDITLAFSGYFFSRFLGIDKGFATGFILTGCYGAEVLQKLGVYPGTFDIKDFLAYTAGVGISFAIDTCRETKKKRNLESKLV